MHMDGRSRLRLGTASNRHYRWLAVLFPVTIVGSIFGQGVLPPAPGFQGAPAVPSMGGVAPLPGANNNQPGGENAGQPNNQGNPTTTDANLPPDATGGGTMDAIKQWGAAHVHPRASYQFLYTTGIHNAPGSSQDTFTHTLSPGLTFNFGSHVNFDYSMGIRFYSQAGFHDTIEHSLALNAAGYNYGKWTFGLSQTAVIADQPLSETSSQTQQQNYHTGLSASYAANEKLTLSTDIGMDIAHLNEGVTNVFVGGSGGTPSSLSDSRSYRGSETLDYKFNEHFSGGMAASLAYTEQLPGFKSVEEEYNLHLNWTPGTKLSASLSGGLEERNFLNSKAAAVWNPIYSANIGYRLFEHTLFTVYANQSINASIFDNELTKSTSVGVGMEQRLLGKLHLSLGFGYRRTEFLSTTTSDLNTSRSDKGTSFSAGLSAPLFQHCSLATFYQYSQDRSSQQGFSYGSSTLGATLSWAY